MVAQSDRTSAFRLALCTCSGRVDRLLHEVYELYADYVLKNPFYEVEQPIRVESWELKLRMMMDAWNHQN